MSFPLNPSNGDFVIVNGIKYRYSYATNSWRRDFNNVLDRLFLVGYNEATNTGTGDLVVLGGGSFGKSLWVGQDLHVLGNIYGNLIGVITTASQAIAVQGGSAGSLIYQTNTSTTGFIQIGSTGSLLVSNGIIPVWTTSAAISVSQATSATNINGGGPWQIPFQSNTGTTTFSPFFQYDTTRLYISNTTTTTSSSTGALVVLGGAGFITDVNIGRNLTVSGNFTVNGTTTFVNSQNLDVTDKNITLAKGATTASMADAGGITIEGPAIPVQWYYNAGTDRWVSNRLVEIPNGYVNSGNNSTATTNGAFTVKGGIGATGNIYADEFFGRFTGPIGLATKNGGNFTALSANDIVNFTSNQNATSTATGALRVVGGVGIGQDLYVGGKIFAIVSTATTAFYANTATNATNADYATTSSFIGGGTAGQIPYQFATGITTFSPNLTWTNASNLFSTVNIKATKIRVEVTSTSYTEGLELINTNTLGNKSPLLRLSTASNSILILNDSGTLAAYVNTTSSIPLFTANNSLFTVNSRTKIANTLTVTNDLLPEFTQVSDLGSVSLQWKNLYINGTAYVAGNVVTSSVIYNGHAVPLLSNSYDVGFSTATWRGIFANSATISTINATTVNGTTGNFTNGTFTNLTATNVTFANFTATQVTASTSTAVDQIATNISATNITVSVLTATNAYVSIGSVNTLTGSTATISTVVANQLISNIGTIANGNFATFSGSSGTVTTMVSVNGIISNLTSDIARIKSAPVSLQSINNAQGVVVHDLANGTGFIHQLMNQNFTANFINVPLSSTGTVAVDLFLVQNNVTSRFADTIQVNGSAVTSTIFDTNAQHGSFATGIHRQRVNLVYSAGFWYALVEYTAFVP